MTKALSVYLDAVRFLAALTVMACHFTFPQFTGGIIPYQGALAGSAVTIFFVLSGYVIAYVADQKEHNLTDFAISRCARIYSVAIPALILTMLIDGVMYAFGHGQNIPLYEYRHFWKYIPVFLIFANEIWTFHFVEFTDGAFWSLSYEVWYYIAFAAAFYLVGWKRLIAVPVILIALGLPALIYLPIWLLGCAIYHAHKRLSFSINLARSAFVLSIAAFLLFRISGWDDRIDLAINNWLGGWPFAHLHNSEHFTTHWIVAIIVGVNFFSARYCNLGLLTKASRPITYLASFTFAIYLAHRPLMNFWAFIIDHDPHSLLSLIVLVFLVGASVFIFAFVSEHRKNSWRSLFRRLLKPGMLASPIHQ